MGHFNFSPEKEPREKALAQALRFRDEYGLFGLNMPVLAGQTQPDDIVRLRREGLWISLWFVQDADKAAFYRPATPDAFVTDHVSLVRQW